MKQIFVRIPKWQDTAHWVTPFCHFVLSLKLISSDGSQILRHASDELLNAHKAQYNKHDFNLKNKKHAAILFSYAKIFSFHDVIMHWYVTGTCNEPHVNHIIGRLSWKQVKISSFYISLYSYRHEHYEGPTSRAVINSEAVEMTGKYR